MSKLDHIPKQSPFKVPDGYFDAFPDRLEEKLDLTVPSRTPMVRQLRPVLSYAALFIGLITIGYMALRLVQADRNGAELSYDELAVAVDYYAHEFDDAILLDAYLEVQAETPGVTDMDQTLAIEEEIIEYLSTEPIDLSQYYAE